MNGASINAAATTVEHEVWVAADQEATFAALTTVDGLDGWWGPALGASNEIGGHVVFDHGLPSPMRMEVVAFDPPARVTWRFASTYTDPDNPASEWTDQTFEWQVEPRRAQVLLGRPLTVTVVRLTNTGWPTPSRWRGFCTTAWGATLDGRLKPYLEATS